MHDTPPNMHPPILFRLLPFLLLVINSNAQPSKPTEAYVTLLYGDFYVLPVRVMMQSLLVNSPDVAAGIRDRVVFVTGQTSDSAISQLRRDNISVRTVPALQSPYTTTSSFRSRFLHVLTKLYVFNMTDYTRVVFIDADSLILRPLSSVFSCGTFCATFINPCNFNSGFMVVTPNATQFKHMQSVLSTTPSYDAGDQGFLNSYFPDLLNAPFFDPSSPPTHPPPLSRLSFAYHADHSAYFLTSSFTFQLSDRCGLLRNIEWLGPPLVKPWLWWTFSVFDLSWQWDIYRSQLSNPFPPGMPMRRNAILLIFLCNLVIAWLTGVFSRRVAFPFILARLLPSLCPFPRLSPSVSALYPVMAGYLLWAAGFSASVILVPRILPPFEAAVVFFYLRVVGNLVVLVGGGLVFCVGQKKMGRARYGNDLKPEGLWMGFREMLSWAVFDAAYIIVWCAILWQIGLRAMWKRAVVYLAVIASQIVFVGVMLARTYLMWLRVTEDSWKSENAT